MFPLVAPEEKIAQARTQYGRSIEEILSKAPRYDLFQMLGAIEVLVGSKLNQNLGTSSAERMVFALTWFAREVGTGGFRQFFINSAGDFWADVLHGLTVIGDSSGADAFRQALAVFPESAPSKDRSVRLRQLDALESEQEEEITRSLAEVTDRYFRSPFPNWNLVFGYVKNHPQEFDFSKA
jgi:hypothetical protein